MTRAATFRQSDVERAIRAVQAAGLPVEAVEIVDGRIRVLTTPPSAPLTPADPFEAWEQSLGGERAA